jgi:hypothetical protein
MADNSCYMCNPAAHTTHICQECAEKWDRQCREVGASLFGMSAGLAVGADILTGTPDREEASMADRLRETLANAPHEMVVEIAAGATEELKHAYAERGRLREKSRDMETRVRDANRGAERLRRYIDQVLLPERGLLRKRVELLERAAEAAGRRRLAELAFKWLQGYTRAHEVDAEWHRNANAARDQYLAATSDMDAALKEVEQG